MASTVCIGQAATIKLFLYRQTVNPNPKGT